MVYFLKVANVSFCFNAGLHFFLALNFFFENQLTEISCECLKILFFLRYAVVEGSRSNES